MSDLKIANMWRYPEAAEFLGISPLTLRRYVMLKKIPYLKPFGKGKTPVLFDPAALSEFVKASRVEPVAV